MSVTSGFIDSLFQSREVSCLEVHVNETKMKSSYKSEVADLNCLSLLFVLWETQLNLGKHLVCFSASLHQGFMGMEVFPELPTC